MKPWIAAAAAMVLLMSAGTATADRHSRGGFHGHGFRGHDFDGRGFHHGGGRYVRGGGGARFYFGIGPYLSPFGYPYAYPYGYPYSYPPYYYSPPVVVTPPPTTYIQPEQQQPQAQSYWYYCTSPKGYYPYVKDCPPGWMKVVPQAPSQ